ncbi:MAG TPA: ABC transporter permease [Ornithinicoccus sp.]|nr:ABC transporter permease [Ornithinicoccus sp.]
MGALRLVLRRAQAGLGLLTTILALTAAAVAIIAGTLGYSQAAATVAARQALTDAVPTEAGIRVQTRLADDPAAQDRGARQIIDAAFRPTSVRVQRTLVSEPRPVSDHEERVVVLASPSLTPEDPEFGTRVEVVEGTWPQADGDPVPGALHAAVAERWGVRVGDTLTVGQTPVVVEALWRPASTQDAFWFGDPLVVAGSRESGEVGPLVVAEAAMTRFGDAPFVQWTVQPDAAQIRPEDMPRLASAAAALRDDLKVPGVEVRGVTVDGDLAPTTAAAASNLATARALNVIPVLLLLLVSIIAVVQIARLQATARAPEVEVLVARGASRRQLVVWSAVEALVVTVVATAIGIGLALVVVGRVEAGDQQADTIVSTGIGTGLAVLVALVTVAGLQARSLGVRAAGADRSGRARQATTLGALLLVPAAALFSWWQLRRYGSPLVRDESGLSTDLVAGAAPALLLAAAAVLAMALLGPASRVVEVVTRARPRLGGHLAAAQVSRRLVMYAVPVVLTVLAVGSTTLASAYAATSAQLRENLSGLAQGAQVRAGVADAPTSPRALVALPDVSEVPATASVPVWQDRTQVGPTEVAVTAMPLAEGLEVATVPEEVLDPAEVVPALGATSATDAGRIPLPDGAQTLTLQLTVSTSVPESVVTNETRRLNAFVTRVLADPVTELRVQGTSELTDQQLANLLFSNIVDLAFQGAATEVTPRLRITQDGGLGTQVLEAAPVDLRITLSNSVSRLQQSRWEDEDADLDLEELFGDITVETRPETVTTAVTVPLPAGTGRTLDGMWLELPQPAYPYELTVSVDALETEDGHNLLTDADLAWQAPEMTSTTEPADYLGRDVELVEMPPVGPGSTDLTVEHDRAAGRLVVTGTTGADRASVFRVAGDNETRQVQVGPPASEDAGPLPVAVTSQLAGTNALAVGDELELRILNTTVPVRIAALVEAVPGTLEPHAVLLDSTRLTARFSEAGQRIPVPSELWFATDDPDATVAALQSVPGIEEVAGPETVAVTDAAAAVRLVFWVASTGAVLLAATGIAAVTTTLLTARRAEVAVLRALGMTPRGQALSRALELLGVVLGAVALGLLAGWLVSALVVPDLATSTTLTGQVPLQATLRLELPLWLALLGLLLVAVAGTAVAVATRVRAQALDNTYREEVR